MKDLVVSQLTGEEMHRGIQADRVAFGAEADAFHRAFYASRFTHNLTNWCGVPILKNPMDVWVYQELIWDLRPTLILETGTAYGGSALFFAGMLDRRGDGRVVSIDVEPHHTLPPHPRITYLRGSSTSAAIAKTVREMAAGEARVMVVLDSDHSQAHVLDELAVYAPLVTPGQFLVVEDTNIDQRPVDLGWMGGPGPGKALDRWLPEHPEFTPDLLAERFGMTFYPGGWLRRAL
jgi:cephalosporin hydroxylase